MKVSSQILMWTGCSAVVMGALIWSGCRMGSSNVDSTHSFPGPVARVKIASTGVIYLNGKNVTLDELKRNFAQTKAANGSVWYYRENPETEAGKEAMSVIEAVVAEKLPIKLCRTEEELNEPQK